MRVVVYLIRPHDRQDQCKETFRSFKQKLFFHFVKPHKMAAGKTKAIDEIDDILEMAQAMTANVAGDENSNKGGIASVTKEA